MVETEASGDKASVHTEITNIVNGQETQVESDQPGEIKVEVKDGEVKVESSSEVQPTIILDQEGEEKKEEMINQTETIKTRIINFFENLISRLKEKFSFFRLDR